MKKTLLRILTAVLLLCITAQPLSVFAEEAVDVGASCSLELEYSNNGNYFSGLEIQIYRVAEIYTDGEYELIAPFDALPVKIHGITAQREWREAANTLAAYIVAQQIAPTALSLTGDDGRVLFSGLETGIYLVMGTSARNAEGTYQFENFCVFLPTPQSDGTQNYNIYAKPKSSFTPEPEQPEETRYQVIKLWKDSGNTNRRPAGITVEIYRNGVLQETVTLNADNNWTYSWTAPAGDDVWTVVEKNVPDGYTVVITESGATFTITNTCPTPEIDPPKTGDTFALKPWLTAMSLSGILLVALGILLKRKRK